MAPNSMTIINSQEQNLLGNQILPKSGGAMAAILIQNGHQNTKILRFERNLVSK
jgi:hypothetical protein